MALAWLVACREPVAGGSLALATGWPAAPPAAGGAAIDPGVAAAMEQGELVRALVYPRASRATDDRVAGGAAVPEVKRLAALQAGFGATAAGVLAAVQSAANRGLAEPPRALWLAGAVAVRAEPGVLAQLAARTDVGYIGPDPVAQLEPWSPEAQAPSLPGAGVVSWGVERIGAPDAWQRLGVDGQGVTVAVLDSGVDYYHPALHGAYRGLLGQAYPDNAGNWWCKAVDPLCGEQPLYPADGVGHGSHVTGTILGQGGIGVAPGARWIAAKVCLQADYCNGSWIVEALQWLVERSPADMPRVVNISLSLEDNLALYQAVQNLLGAGIVLVSSSGNDGARLRAPATYPGVLVVGAMDEDGHLWPDSGRGTSLDNQVKPDVVAPGVAIRSSVPGGSYALNTGTSMAAPHVAGAAALLLQAEPDLDVAQVAEILRATARPLEGVRDVPDASSGWGQVDAYDALLTVVDVGQLAGRVTRATDSQPIPWARVRVATPAGDPVTSTTVGADGSYSLDLSPGTYLVMAEAFAFVGSEPIDVSVVKGGMSTADFSLPLRDDLGTLGGSLSDALTGAPLDASVQLAGLPPEFAITVNPVGQFSVLLPAGAYDVTVSRFGYRVLLDSVKIEAGVTVERQYRLDPTPRILLVDGDAWAYSTAINYYRQSLDRLRYTYNVMLVTDQTAAPGQPGGPPTADQLRPYDLVIWSSSITGPTYVRGAGSLSAYLAQGGRLFLSGQDALCTDAGTAVSTDLCNAKARPDPYVRDQLDVQVLADNARSTSVQGSQGGPFDGMQITLNGPDSADNQSTPDVIEVSDPLRGKLVATYANGGGAAVLAEGCIPHRSLVLGFGFEGVEGTATRDELLHRAIDALMATRPANAGLIRADADSLIAPAGTTAVFTGTLTNVGTASDDFDLAITSSPWPAALWQPGLEAPLGLPLRLEACQNARFAVRLAVPERTPRGAAGRVMLQAVGRTGGVTSTLALTARTPAAVLVVDGDYGRDTEASYLQALAATGTPYDLWTIGRDGGTARVPTLADLDGYPALVWFTGDDWRPTGSVNLPEQRAMAQYLDAGGRLYFSSEDYLSIRGATPFEDDTLFQQAYLGVASYVENEGAAHAGPLAGAPGSILANFPSCAPASKSPEEDFSDRLEPGGVGGRAALLNVFGRAVATQASNSAFRTLFLAFDASTLPPPCASAVMASALDWFSPLADSSLSLEPPEATSYASGDQIRLRLDLRNASMRALDGVHVDWTVPVSATLDTSVLPARWSWMPETRTLSFTGDLARNQTLSPAPEILLTLDEDLPQQARMASTAVLAGDGITVTRSAAWRVNTPDLGQSTKSVPDEERVRERGQTASFAIQVRNTGTLPAAGFVLTDTVPAGLELDPTSVLVDRGAPPTVGADGTIVWQGEVDPDRVASLSYRARVQTTSGGWLTNRAVLYDGAGTTIVLSATIFVMPRLYFPWASDQPEAIP